jgi:hypothetical protein
VSRILRLVAVPAATLILLAGAGSALAATPEREVVIADWDYDIPADVCGFPLQEHVEGTIRITTFAGSDGHPERILVTHVGFRVTWSNPASGASVTHVGAASNHTTNYEDGSATVMITGLQGHFKSPDGGFIQSDIGRVVLFCLVATPCP